MQTLRDTVLVGVSPELIQNIDAVAEAANLELIATSGVRAGTTLAGGATVGTTHADGRSVDIQPFVGRAWSRDYNDQLIAVQQMLRAIPGAVGNEPGLIVAYLERVRFEVHQNSSLSGYHIHVRQDAAPKVVAADGKSINVGVPIKVWSANRMVEHDQLLVNIPYSSSATPPGPVTVSSTGTIHIATAQTPAAGGTIKGKKAKASAAQGGGATAVPLETAAAIIELGTRDPDEYYDPRRTSALLTQKNTLPVVWANSIRRGPPPENDTQGRLRSAITELLSATLEGYSHSTNGDILTRASAVLDAGLEVDPICTRALGLLTAFAEFQRTNPDGKVSSSLVTPVQRVNVILTGPTDYWGDAVEVDPGIVDLALAVGFHRHAPIYVVPTVATGTIVRQGVNWGGTQGLWGINDEGWDGNNDQGGGGGSAKGRKNARLSEIHSFLRIGASHKLVKPASAGRPLVKVTFSGEKSGAAPTLKAVNTYIMYIERQTSLLGNLVLKEFATAT